MCLQGWVFLHFRNLIPRNLNEEYDPTVAPLVDKWKPPKSFSDPGHYKNAIDSLDHSHVIWRPYERRRHITPFQDICWYYGWIMAGKRQDGPSLARAGSWVVRVCPDYSQASYRHWASCARGGGNGLHGVCSTCPQPVGEGWSCFGWRVVEAF